MTLSFSTEMFGRHNYFPHKIWKSLLLDKLTNENFVKFCYSPWFRKFGETMPMVDDVKPKYHTIRLNRYNQWKEGSLIHFVIKNRTANRFQFAPVVKCTGTQIIHILKFKSGVQLVKVDGVLLSEEEVERLAVNDGFDNSADFFQYFNKTFYGILIHWSDIRY